MATIAAGAAQRIRKYTVPKILLLKVSVPPLVNSSFTSSLFILHPTNTTQRNPPAANNTLEENLSRASNIGSPAIFTPASGPNDNEHKAPTTAAKQNTTTVALLRVKPLSSIKYATPTSNNDTVEVSAATRMVRKNNTATTALKKGIVAPIVEKIYGIV